MTYKNIFVFLPLVISSIADLPIRPFENTKYISSGISIVPPVESREPIIQYDYFNCDFYGPYSIDDLHNITVTFVYNLSSISSQYLIERLRLFNSSNAVVSTASKNSFYYTKGNRKEVSFTISLVDYFSNNGLTLKFELLKSSSYEIIKDYSATFFPRSSSYISGVTLKRNIYKSRSLGFYGKNNKLNEVYETFDFTNFGDYLDIDYYYRLEIDKISFLYPNSYDFTYEYAYLWFNDDDNIFPYYKHQSNGDIYIPITLYRKDDEIHFKYSKSFYINKRTLQISDTYRSGFVSTKDFYLPVNGKSKFNNKQLCFELHNMGLDGLSTSLYLRYDTSKSLVGVCTDGDYCIIGGKR